MTDRTEKITLTISRTSVEKLREIAQELGFTTTAGRMSGQGNISGLLEAVAQAEYRIVPAQQASATQGETVPMLKAYSPGWTEHEEELAYFEAAISTLQEAIREGEEARRRILFLLTRLRQRKDKLDDAPAADTNEE